MRVFLLKKNEVVVCGYMNKEKADNEARELNIKRDPRTNDFYYTDEVEVIE